MTTTIQTYLIVGLDNSITAAPEQLPCPVLPPGYTRLLLADGRKVRRENLFISVEYPDGIVHCFYKKPTIADFVGAPTYGFYSEFSKDGSVKIRDPDGIEYLWSAPVPATVVQGSEFIDDPCQACGADTEGSDYFPRFCSKGCMKYELQ